MIILLRTKEIVKCCGYSEYERWPKGDFFYLSKLLFYQPFEPVIPLTVFWNCQKLLNFVILKPLVPTIFFVVLFGVFSLSGELTGNDPIFWESRYSPFLPAGIFSVIYIGALSFVFIKTPEGLFKKAQKRGFKFSFIIFLLLLFVFVVVTNYSYFYSLVVR